VANLEEEALDSDGHSLDRGSRASPHENACLVNRVNQGLFNLIRPLILL
jgi:hypothetical protein